MLAWLKDRGEAAKTEAQNALKRYNNKETMEAIVSGCVIVAAADGSIDPKEKLKMMKYLEISPEMKVFDTKQVLGVFKEITDMVDMDLDIGKVEALRRIAKIKKDAGAAETVVRICIIIGAADGNFDKHERAVVREICGTLGLAPSQFDLDEAA